MREIIFRGKSKSSNKFVTGDLKQYRKSKSAYIIVQSYYEDEAETEPKLFEYEVDPLTIGQYTGLHDKNGTMIFEGDIISVSNYMLDEEVGNAVVLWDDESAMFAISFKGIQISFDQVYYGDFEVIGNIYDNGELIFDGGSGDVYDL